MSRAPATRSSTEARRRGRQAMIALRTVAIGVFAALAIYAVVAIFLPDPPPPPPWVWSVAVLVAPAVLAVWWRPTYRVPNCLFLTGATAFMIGLVGAGFGSLVAPVVGGLTLVALFFAPRGGGQRAQQGRNGAEDDRA